MLGHLFKVYGVDSFKPGYDPVTGLIMSGIGAVGSLGSSLIGGSSQIDAVNATNRANLQATRETNEQNYKMFHEAQDFTESMWNKTNQYNSPVEQVHRLREAGINPSAVLGSNGQGTIGQAGISSSPQPIPAIAPHFQAPDYSPMIAGISRSIDSFFQNQNQDADAKLKLMELGFKAGDHEVELRRRNAEIDEILSRKDVNQTTKEKLLSEKESNDFQLGILREVRDNIVKKYDLDNGLLEANKNKLESEKEAQDLQNDYQRVQNDFQKVYNDKQLQQMDAAIKEAFSAVNLNNKNAEKAVMETFESKCRSYGIKLDNYHKSRLNPLIRKTVRLEQKSLNTANKIQDINYYNPLTYVGQIFGGAGAQAVKALSK